MRANKQINVYLSEAEKSSFEAYARKYLLDGAGLMALLFAREMRVGRLRALIEDYPPPDATRKSKVTFRASESDHAAVLAHVAAHGCGLSAAGATLARAEAREHWLGASISTRFESPR